MMLGQVGCFGVSWSSAHWHPFRSPRCRLVPLSKIEEAERERERAEAAKTVGYHSYSVFDRLLDEKNGKAKPT